jgi:hypothetical protein
MNVDDVNGLMYLSVRWLAHVSLLPQYELKKLEAGLLDLAHEHDTDDQKVLNLFAQAVATYIEE